MKSKKIYVIREMYSPATFRVVKERMVGTLYELRIVLDKLRTPLNTNEISSRKQRKYLNSIDSLIGIIEGLWNICNKNHLYSLSDTFAFLYTYERKVENQRKELEGMRFDYFSQKLKDACDDIRSSIIICRAAFEAMNAGCKTIEKILSSQETKNCIVYFEGSEKDISKLPHDLLKACRKYMVRIEALDEGNQKYEEVRRHEENMNALIDALLRKLIKALYGVSPTISPNLEEIREMWKMIEDEAERFRRSTMEMQAEREKIWVEKIERVKEGYTLIIVVSADYPKPPYSNLKMDGSHKNFIQKLEERGFEPIVFDITEML